MHLIFLKAHIAIVIILFSILFKGHFEHDCAFKEKEAR